MYSHVLVFLEESKKRIKNLTYTVWDVNFIILLRLLSEKQAFRGIWIKAN